MIIGTGGSSGAATPRTERQAAPMSEPFPFLSATPVVPPAALLTRACGLPAPRVALVNAGAEHPLEGLREAVDAGFAEPILVGDREKIARTAETIDWDITGIPLHHAPKDAAATRAAELARSGQAQAVMKGQVHTSVFLRALLTRSAGLREPDARCGHLFHITAPGSDRPLILTDAALNVDPSIATRQACLTHAVALARTLGIDRPKAALLSANEDPTPALQNSMEAAEIAAWAQSALPEAEVAGPMALDLVFSRAAAAAKHYESPVAGDADIMLVPNITSGNALFKLMVLGMSCCAAGIVAGLKVPVLLTSRSQQAPDRIASAALGAIAAAGGR